MKLGIVLVLLVIVKLLLKSEMLKPISFCCTFFTKSKVVKEVMYAY